MRRFQKEPPKTESIPFKFYRGKFTEFFFHFEVIKEERNKISQYNFTKTIYQILSNRYKFYKAQKY